MPDEKLLRDQFLAAYREIAPDHSTAGEHLITKLAAELYRRGCRISIGEPIAPPERFIHHSLDPQQRIVWTCKHWNAVMGYRNRAAVDRHISEFLTPDSMAFLQEVAWPSFLRTGHLPPTALTFVTRQGELLPAVGKSEMLRDSDGTFVRTFAKIRIRLPLLHPLIEAVSWMLLVLVCASSSPPLSHSRSPAVRPGIPWYRSPRHRTA